MRRLIILQGLPGSGKTTWAEEFVAKDPESRVRINRDHLRKMMHKSVYIARDDEHMGTERAIRRARNAILTELLLDFDVVIDDTNITIDNDILMIAKTYGVEPEIMDFTDVSVDECIRRNAKRPEEDRVPDRVILLMADQLKKARAR